MELVKKNLISIICGVIALLAVGAVFWPIKGYYDQLQKTEDGRKIVAKQINDLLNKHRRLPLVSADATPDQQKPLEGFPTRPVIDTWKAVTDKIASESADLFKTAVEMNKQGHELLMAGSLPNGKNDTTYPFRALYKEVMDANTPSTPESRAKSLAWKLLKGGSPPTELQIRDRQKEVEDSLMKSQAMVTVPANLQETINNAKNDVPEELAQEAAKNCMMYIDTVPPALAYYDKVTANPNAPPELASVFIAQLELWVQQDVLLALKDANSTGTSVLNSPIKQLRSLRITGDSIGPFLATPVAAAAAPPGATATVTDPKAPFVKKYGRSPTGRDSNGVYDIIRFRLELFVDAEKIPLVFQELSRNKFIAVSNSNIQEVDSAGWQSRRYLYGDKPVVQLSMDCEELFLREWTQAYMPATVRKALGIVDQPTAAK